MKIYLVYLIIFLATIIISYLAHNLLSRKWGFALGISIFYLAICYFMWSVTEPINTRFMFSDFSKAYYESGRLIWNNSSDLYLAKGSIKCPGFVNLPLVAILFTPFSYLPRKESELLFFALGISAMIGFVYYWFRFLGINRKSLFILGLIGINGPLFYSIKMGNTTHILLLPLLGVFWCLYNKREFFTGALIAIIGVIKIPLLCLGIYFLFRRKWHIFISFLITFLAIILTSFFWFKWDLNWLWYQQCIKTSSGHPIGAFNVQSIDGFLVRLLSDTKDTLINWSPLNVGLNFKVLRYLILSGLLGQTFWIFLQTPKPTSPEEENLELSIFLCLALVISPISWSHYYAFLLVPFGLYFAGRLMVPQGKYWQLGIIASILLTSLPVIMARNSYPLIQWLYFKFLISHYFFGGLLFLEILLLAKWQNAKSLKKSEDII